MQAVACSQKCMGLVHESSETEGILDSQTVLLRLEDREAWHRDLQSTWEVMERHHKELMQKLGSRMKQRREMNIGCGRYCRLGTRLSVLSPGAMGFLTGKKK